MFGFFKKKKVLENKQENEVQGSGMQAAAGATAPGTQIHYHPELIAELQRDHQQLLALFGAIKQTYADGGYDRLPGLLNQFGSMLRGHLLKENVKLYVYLQHVLANDPENCALMQGFRTEMQGIGKAVTEFLQRYSADDWDQGRRTGFGSDLDAIGEVLVKRIETEESVLYSLYLAPDAYR